MTNLQKTKRVIIVALSAVGAAALLSLIGVMVINRLSTDALDRQNLYITAHQVTEENVFVYLLATAGGRTLVSGNIETQRGVSHEDLNGEWFAIRWQQERYTEVTKTRNVTDAQGDFVRDRYGYPVTETYTTTEWQNVGERRARQTADYTFLNQRLNADISFGGYQRLNPRDHARNPVRVDAQYIYDTRSNRVGTIRTSFEVIPMRFSGTMFIDIAGPNEIQPPYGNVIRFHHDRSIEQVRDAGMRNHATIFSVVWVIISIGVTVLVVCKNYRLWLGDG